MNREDQGLTVSEQPNNVRYLKEGISNIKCIVIVSLDAAFLRRENTVERLIRLHPVREYSQRNWILDFKASHRIVFSAWHSIQTLERPGKEPVWRRIRTPTNGIQGK